MRRAAWQAALAAVLVGGSLAATAYGQMAYVNLRSDLLQWDWSKGDGGDIEAFAVGCGTVNGVYDLPPYVVPVTGAPLSYAGQVPAAAVLPAPGQYFCVIGSFNAYGKSVSPEAAFLAGDAAVAPAQLRAVRP